MDVEFLNASICFTQEALECNIQIQHLETFKSSLKSNNNKKCPENPLNESSAVLAVTVGLIPPYKVSVITCLTHKIMIKEQTVYFRTVTLVLHTTTHQKEHYQVYIASCTKI